MEEYLKRVNDDYLARRTALIDGLRAIPGVTCPEPGGAFCKFANAFLWN